MTSAEFLICLQFGQIFQVVSSALRKEPTATEEHSRAVHRRAAQGCTGACVCARARGRGGIKMLLINLLLLVFVVEWIVPMHKMYCLWMMKFKEDIQMLIEEGRLNHKLNELDKLERSAMNNPNSAWSVKNFFFLGFISYLHRNVNIWIRLFVCQCPWCLGNVNVSMKIHHDDSLLRCVF